MARSDISDSLCHAIVIGTIQVFKYLITNFLVCLDFTIFPGLRSSEIKIPGLQGVLFFGNRGTCVLYEYYFTLKVHKLSALFSQDAHMYFIVLSVYILALQIRIYSR